MNNEIYEAADNHSAVLPNDFPSSPKLGAVAGAQSKILAVCHEQLYYSLGCTPPEIMDRWRICEDIACQLSKKSLESKSGKRACMKEVEILDQYFPRLVATAWVSEAEAKWIIRRMGRILNWEIPFFAKE